VLSSPRRRRRRGDEPEGLPALWPSHQEIKSGHSSLAETWRIYHRAVGQSIVARPTTIIANLAAIDRNKQKQSGRKPDWSGSLFCGSRVLLQSRASFVVSVISRIASLNIYICVCVCVCVCVSSNLLLYSASRSSFRISRRRASAEDGRAGNDGKSLVGHSSQRISFIIQHLFLLYILTRKIYIKTY